VIVNRDLLYLIKLIRRIKHCFRKGGDNRVVIKLKKSVLFKISVLAIMIITLSVVTISLGMDHYYNVDFTTGLVTASLLNVRSGPGTKFPIVATVKKNEYIRVFAGIGDWYVVQLDSNYIGAVSKKYIKPIYPNTGTGTGLNNNDSNNNNTTNTTNLTSDEWEVFNLINQQRSQNGLSPLKIDYDVQRVARIKAQDMVNNNYFSHTSPTYGSPFNMLNNFKVSYRTAGENIAGNSSNSAAVTAWMNSSGHKANILNSSFNYTGIGVINGSKYGKIYVQMFIGK
jgi:uncharacterized protein, ykwD family